MLKKQIYEGGWVGGGGGVMERSFIVIDGCIGGCSSSAMTETTRRIKSDDSLA